MSGAIAKLLATPPFQRKAAEQCARADGMNAQKCADFTRAELARLRAGGEGVEDRGRLTAASTHTAGKMRRTGHPMVARCNSCAFGHARWVTDLRVIPQKP